MLSLTVSQNSDQPLVEQIVAGVKRQIDDRHLRPGSKLPSIRSFADAYGVSRFTVVEAYDRLVALGYLQSRRGAGFYTSVGPVVTRTAPSDDHKRNEQLVWLIRQLLSADDKPVLAGGPWLPNSWLDEAGIRQSLNVLARKNGAHLLEYGNPFGYLPLREHLALTLAGLGITAHAGQILLTQGTSQALELVIRYLLKPGDAALVDDPGYYNMFGNLRLQGVQMLAVPRNPDGPDRRAEKLAQMDVLKKELAALESKAGERIGKLAIRAGLTDLNLDDDTLVKEFQAIAGRFRAGKAEPDTAHPSSPDPA
jgi:DNA-binding transcriptional MocR family regulator